MTTLNRTLLRCAVCGEESEHLLTGSTYTTGSPDFDTRPPELMRSTIIYWLQECPSCGYAAPDLREAHEAVGDIVRSSGYQQRQGAFVRHSFLLESLGHFSEAGWTALHGAWLADDRGDEAEAGRLRLLATSLWKRGKTSGQNFMDSFHEEFALVTDVFRRAGAFDEALATCRAGLDSEDLPTLIEDLLRMELSLIQRRDTACHSLSELPQHPPGARRVSMQ